MVASAPAERLKLRALDLLHVAYVAILSDHVRTLVTRRGTARKGKVVERTLGISIKHPGDL